MPKPNRTAEVLDRLTTGISQLTTSERWAEWLRVQSSFHRYSFGNTLLILEQTGGEATRVAGYHAWRKLGRNVRKGENAIWILAPMTRVIKEDDEDDGKRIVAGFKAAPVFDVAQTDGEPLPEVTTALSGEDLAGSFDRLREVAETTAGYRVEVTGLPGNAHGDCTFDLKRIRIEMSNDGRQQVKTLAHELAHALLHDGFEGTRELAELEAESVAFIVCAHLGIASDDYSFGYVAAWSGGGDEALAAIRTSGGRIQRAADTILSAC